MVVFFVKSNENTYPKGRALMQMYRGVPIMKRGNCSGMIGWGIRGVWDFLWTIFYVFSFPSFFKEWFVELFIWYYMYILGVMVKYMTAYCVQC